MGAKYDYQKNFKFSIAMENECYMGYVTEKIVEAFCAGTVPIYLGDPDIAEDFNVESFVKIADADSFTEAIDQVLEIDSDLPMYLKMRNSAVYADDSLPEYAREENIMSFF